jgi:hypothetical protein
MHSRVFFKVSSQKDFEEERKEKKKVFKGKNVMVWLLGKMNGGPLLRFVFILGKRQKKMSVQVGSLFSFVSAYKSLMKRKSFLHTAAQVQQITSGVTTRITLSSQPCV